MDADRLDGPGGGLPKFRLMRAGVDLSVRAASADLVDRAPVTDLTTNLAKNLLRGCDDLPGHQLTRSDEADKSCVVALQSQSESECAAL